MRAVVVGAGVWGLSAGAELSRRGHHVTVLDRFGVGNAWSSSAGATRIWRLAHADAGWVRAAVRSVEAWRRLESRTGLDVLVTRGLLWRDDTDGPAVAAALAQVGVPHQVVEPSRVGDVFPGLVPDARFSVWQPEAGAVLAAVALEAAGRVLAASGGSVLAGVTVEDVVVRGEGVLVEGRGPDGDPVTYPADVAVLAPGPGAPVLLERLGVDVPLTPILEQVSYVDGRSAGADARDLPSLIEGADEEWIYGMATPGTGPASGWKLGADAVAPRPFDLDSREPDAHETSRTTAWVRRWLPDLSATPTYTQVCSYTIAPGREFVLERVHDGRVVLGVGDSGRGYKFGAYVGELLADLAEDRADATTAEPMLTRWTRERWSG